MEKLLSGVTTDIPISGIPTATLHLPILRSSSDDGNAIPKIVPSPIRFRKIFSKENRTGDS
jgi:hypothetical protein